MYVVLFFTLLCMKMICVQSFFSFPPCSSQPAAHGMYVHRRKHGDTCVVCQAGEAGNSLWGFGSTVCRAAKGGQYIDYRKFNILGSILVQRKIKPCTSDSTTTKILRERQRGAEPSWSGLDVDANAYKMEGWPIPAVTQTEIAARAACLTCPYGAKGVLEKCEYCPAGRFSDATTLQARNGYTPTFNDPKTQQRVCKDCPAGYYSDGPGNKLRPSCKQCPNGYYQGDPGSSSCVDASPYGTDGPGAEAMNQCKDHQGEDWCKYGASCRYGPHSSYCHCHSGYKGDRCDEIPNFCDPNPCLNGGDCKQRYTEQWCECVPGFYGSECENILGSGTLSSVQSASSLASPSQAPSSSYGY